MTLDFSRRGYAGGAPNTTLNGGITNSATSLTLTSGTSYPTSNFLIVLDPGTASEEKVFVGSRSGTACTSCTRGVDGTSGVSHLSGAVVVHKAGAQDLDEANQIASALTTKGDLLVKGGTSTVSPARLAAGADGSRLTAASGQTLGMSWIADTTNTAIGAAGDLLIGTANDTLTNLATSGLTGFTSDTPTLTQSGAVSKTVTYARHVQIGKLVIFQFYLDVTGAGSANNAITVALPVAAAVSTAMIVGTGSVFDASAGVIYGSRCRLSGASAVSFSSDSGTATSAVSVGATSSPMTAALASGDVVFGSVMYEAA